MRDLGTLYQSEIVRIFALMTESEFEKMDCVFSCKHDPSTKKPFSYAIDNSEFKEINLDNHSFLFKLCAK